MSPRRAMDKSTLSSLLLVDDDVGALQFLQSCVGDLAELRVARNAGDALRLVRQRPPDLVVLDLHLGDADADGLGLLLAMRTDEALMNVPVIFISAELNVTPQVRALELDALDWLVKPVDPRRLRARVQAALRRATGLVAAGPAPSGPLRGARVLAVDDDPIVLESLRQALSLEGFELRTAMDAASALAMVAAEPPEVVLLDMVLPGDDGFSLAHRLMAMPSLHDVPLIFVTQYGDVAAESRALGLGAFDFIAKPIVPQVLRARVCNALRLRRRSALALQQAEARWRQLSGEQLSAIVAHAHDPIVCIDAQARLRLANDAARRLLGDGEASRIGSPLPEGLRALLPTDLLDGSTTRVLGITLPAHNGGSAVYDIAATSLAPGGEQLVSLTFVDQTARAAAEAQAFRQARMEAEHEARALMVSYLAHEIGNPLNGIMGLTRLLLDGAEPLSNDQRHKLLLVADSAEVLGRLMTDTLDLVRWQSGRFSIHLAPVRLRDAIEPTLGALVGLAQQKNVTLAAPRGDLDVLVTADAHRLRQCLHNLVSNACKYNRPGGQVGLEVSVAANEVCIAVSDDGMGMTAEQIARLFQPFERLGRQGTGGHGLGLAVTRMLAEAMNGRLDASASAGVGSRFTLVLPHPAAEEA